MNLALALSLVLALSACTPKVIVGERFCRPGETPAPRVCQADPGSSVPATESPSPTAPPPSSPTPTPSSSAPSAPSIPPRSGETYPIVVRDQFHGYDPREKVVYQGDFILFTNKDTTHKHSWTLDNNALDSGPLAAGQSKRMKVTLPVGEYTWHDTETPYLLGGPLKVLKPPV